MDGFRFNRRNVQIASTVDMPRQFEPRAPLGWIVQAVLDQTEPWNQGDNPIETIDVDAKFRAIVVPNGRTTPFWGIHLGHKARRPQPSPFVRIAAPIISTFTIELVGTPSHPRLVRAYPGEYIPPLPWQNSARGADGGKRACTEFWQRNSYVHGKRIMRALPRDAVVPPPWFHN